MKSAIAFLFLLDPSIIPLIEDQIIQIKNQIGEDVDVCHVVPQEYYQQEHNLPFSGLLEMLERQFHPKQLKNFFSPLLEKPEIASLCHYLAEHTGNLYIIGGIDDNELQEVMANISKERIVNITLMQADHKEELSTAPDLSPSATEKNTSMYAGRGSSETTGAITDDKRIGVNEVIGISFTLKNQSFDGILPVIQKIAAEPLSTKYQESYEH